MCRYGVPGRLISRSSVRAFGARRLSADRQICLYGWASPSFVRTDAGHDVANRIDDEFRLVVLDVVRGVGLGHVFGSGELRGEMVLRRKLGLQSASAKAWSTNGGS